LVCWMVISDYMRTMTAEFDLRKLEFTLLLHYLPREPLQRGSITNKQVVDALIWAGRTRRAATQVPLQYGTREAFRKRSERWSSNGIWADILSALPTLNLSDERRAELRAIAEREDRRGKRIIAFRSNPKG
jgi:transposase